ncbi:hypothetical protein LTR94_026165, partial [Friedmanniomyces endolithicus]
DVAEAAACLDHPAPDLASEPDDQGLDCIGVDLVDAVKRLGQLARTDRLAGAMGQDVEKAVFKRRKRQNFAGKAGLHPSGVGGQIADRQDGVQMPPLRRTRARTRATSSAGSKSLAR